MCVMNDAWILEACLRQPPMISPFEPRMVSDVSPSYGLSSYGYDFRLGPEFKIFTNSKAPTSIVDPVSISPECYIDHVGDCIIPPHSFVLARSLEYFRIPREVLALCMGKSTYARSGIFVGITPAEPEWEGHLTIEISNATPLPAKVYAYRGISQMIFIKAASTEIGKPGGICAVSYKDRRGKYQNQTGVTLPR